MGAATALRFENLDIENDLAPLENAKNLVCHSPVTPAAIHSNASLAEMVLCKLLCNAIRYTKYGGVLIACRLRAGSAVIEVWDTGIGIAPENHSDIVKEFHQLGNPERDRRQGLSLSLGLPGEHGGHYQRGTVAGHY